MLYSNNTYNIFKNGFILENQIIIFLTYDLNINMNICFNITISHIYYS